MVRRGSGTGHLRRCLEIADMLNSDRRTQSPAAVHLSGDSTLGAVDAILKQYPRVPVCPEIDSPIPGTVVLDRRESSQAFVDGLKRSSRVIAIDEAGSGRGYCDYLIDTFLAPRMNPEPNVRVQPAKPPLCVRGGSETTHDKILVTFGGEDPAALTPLVCETLVRKIRLRPKRITAVRGPSAPSWKIPEGVTLLENQAELREELHRYDLVITSFGLTAFEALGAGVSVLLVNPTRYHRRLSKKAGFPTAGVRRVCAKYLLKVIENPDGYAESMAKLRRTLSEQGWEPSTDGFARMAGILAAQESETGACPLCGDISDEVVARFPDKNYYRCSCTGVIYLRNFHAIKRDYGASYFFEEYKSQYGKTYLEDFQDIMALAAPRLRMIRDLIPKGGRLLDVGCAYGPFLTAAKDAGFSCYGTDVSSDAVEYVNDRLGIPAIEARYPDFDPKPAFGIEGFDCLTMWYVIEHFENLESVIARSAGLLGPGGVFAFSTPNLRGVSGRKNQKDFLLHSPADHYTVWSPKTAARVMERYGFAVRRVRITGHHPERFPGISRAKGRLLPRLAMTISKVFKLGDTFEVYAVKRGNGI